MNLTRLPVFLLVAVMLTISGTSLFAAPDHGSHHQNHQDHPPTAQTPTGPVEVDDDSTPAPVDDAPDISYAPEAPAQPYVPAHYTMDDLTNSIQSLGPNPTDTSHYSIDDIGGL